MNKLFTKIGTAIVGLAMAVGVGFAVGRDGAKEVRATDPVETIDRKDTDVDGVIGASGGAADSIVRSDITLNFSKCWKKSANDFIGIYSNSTVEFVQSTSLEGYSIKFKSIVMTASSSGNLQTWSASDSSTVSIDSTKFTATWSNNVGLSTITLTNTAGAQAKILSISVTYSKTASGYTVTYDGNGATSGSVPTDSTGYANNADVTVKANSGNLQKNGFDFAGWNTQSDGEGSNYEAGSGTFKITGNTTLYAKWVEKSTSNLALSGTYPVSFFKNGTFAHDGLIATASFTAGGSYNVADLATYTGYNLSNSGKQTVTVAFGGASSSYEIYVSELLNPINGELSEKEETFTASEQGYDNAQEVSSYTGEYFSISFSSGSKYYDTGSAVRVYAGGNFVVSSDYYMSQIVVTYDSGDDGNTVTSSPAAYSAGTWTGNAKQVTFSVGGSKGNRRIKSIETTCEAPKSYQQKDADVQAALMQFVDQFNLVLGTTGTAGASSESKICKTDGSTNLEALAAAWGSNNTSGLYKLFVDKRAGLTGEGQQDLFDNMVKYASKNPEGDSLQKALSLYDHLVVNRGMVDFLNTVSGRGAASVSAGSIRLNNVSNNSGIIAIIVISAAISTIALIGFVLTKKRKED